MLLFTSGSIELILIIAVPDDPSALDENTHLLHCHPGRRCLSSRQTLLVTVTRTCILKRRWSSVWTFRTGGMN